MSWPPKRGGSGKSTLAIGLSLAAQEDGHSVRLIETDKQDTLSNWQSRRGLSVPIVEAVYDAKTIEQRLQALERGGVTLTVIEEYARATPGRVLPARRRTTTRDLRTGVRLGWEQVVEAHCRLDHVWLPSTWEVTAETTAGSHVFRLELFAHQLL